VSETMKARKHQNPAKGVLETSIGPVDFSVTSGSHVYLESRRYDEDGSPTTPIPVVINRVEYHLSAHLHLKADGSWDANSTNEVNLSRAGSLKAFDYTLSAVQKARSVLSEAWARYAAGHPEILKAAKRSHVNNEIIGVDEKIAETEDALAKLRSQREALLTLERSLS